MIQSGRRFAVKRLFVLAGLFVLSVLVVCVLTLLFSTDLRCTRCWLADGCRGHSSLQKLHRTVIVTADNMLKHLEQERTERGLVLHEWIACREAPAGGFGFMNDPHWLPSYVPGTYQFRRTVIIARYSNPTERSAFFTEVCLMPWKKYLRQIAGQCDGKFSVWK